MSLRKRIIREKTERRSVDAVTGETIVVRLDAVQLALERVHQTLDSHMLTMTQAEQHRLVERVHELLAGMVPHTD